MAIASVLDPRNQAGEDLDGAAAIIELIALHRPTNAEDVAVLSRAAHVALDLVERAKNFIDGE